MLALTWAVVVILLLGYAVEPQDARLLPVLSFLVAGIAGLVLARRQANERTLLAAYLLPGLATAFGLLVLGIEGIWDWWMALTGVGALFAMAPGGRPAAQAVRTFALLILFAAILGVLLSDSQAIPEATGRCPSTT
jgi:hypothetical protein